MIFDIARFRTSFPEFSDKVKYPDGMVEVWSGFAATQVSQSVWKTTWIMGVSLYTAHELVLAAGNVKTAKVGGTPGSQGGIANSKSVGQGSISYDTTSTAEKDAGYWNLTTYGKQYYRLLKIYGAGCIQL